MGSIPSNTKTVERVPNEAVLMINPSGILTEKESDIFSAGIPAIGKKSAVLVSDLVKAIKNAAFDDIIDLTKELLHKLKINDIDIYTFEDKDECIYPENPCKNIQMKTSDANIQKSNKLNMQIKKVGLKYGYYDILVARLN